MLEGQLSYFSSSKRGKRTLEGSLHSTQTAERQSSQAAEPSTQSAPHKLKGIMTSRATLRTVVQCGVALLACLCLALAAPAPVPYPMPYPGPYPAPAPFPGPYPQPQRPPVSDSALDGALQDRRYLQRQLKCALGEAPCDPVGRRLKTLAPLVLRGACPQCSPQETRQIQKVLSHIQRNYPREWSKLIREYAG